MYLQDSLSSRHNNFALMRHIAALLVVYGHCYPLSYSAVKNSHTPDPFSRLVFDYLGFSVGIAGQAVCVFFFISGLLIAKSAASQPWGGFWKARLLRIYPALWGNIACCVLLGMWCSSLAWDAFLQHPAVWQFIWMNGMLWQAVGGLPYVFEDIPWQAVNGSLWTLPHELKMYGYCFALAMVGLLRRRGVCNLLFIVFIITYLLTENTWLLTDTHATRLPIYFMLGVMSYVNAPYLRLHGGIAVGLWAVALAGHGWLPRPCYNMLFAIALSYAVLYLAYRYYVARLDIGRIGDFSYGIYLYGFPVQQWWVWVHGGMISPEWLGMLTLCLLLPLAIASWFLIEKPALALRHYVIFRGAILKQIVGIYRKTQKTRYADESRYP